tara:strand:+ start:191099 stop:192241 length:1143 start_codon:yes stop_codon:yes gene_type:complete
MQLKYFILFLILCFSFCSCKKDHTIVNPLEKALSSKLPNIKSVMDSLEEHEIQIRYTQINRKNDSVIFTDFDYQVNPKYYFYPASTVKLPVAVLALEKLNTIEGFDLHTKFFIEGDTLETTIAKEIVKIFSVSDNEAYNRLFEFLGQNEINEQLKNKGIHNVRISHRLATPNADDITTKPLIVYINDSTTQARDKIINTAIKPLSLDGIKKGKAYYEDNVLIQEPFDFSLKNQYSIEAQHTVLERIIFPENFSKEQQFKLTKEQREFLLTALHTLPKELGYPEKEYYDSYVKFFMFGDHQKPIPKTIEIYNKVGYAYGTLTDCAYIKDIENQIDFLVTATILVNQNEIFNDNIYEYDTIGIPFLAELGRVLYQQELQRLK